MKLLWIELKKLAWRGLRVAASLFLLISVLVSGMGTAVVMAAPPDVAPGEASADGGSRLVHLQLLGGLVHLHESAPIHDAHHPAGAGEYDQPHHRDTAGAPVYYSAYSTVLSAMLMSGAGDNLYSVANLAKLQPARALALEPLRRLARQRLANDPPRPGPYRAVPLNPPIV